MNRSVLALLVALLSCAAVPAHALYLTVWKCKEATAAMPGHIQDFEKQFNAIVRWPPSQKKTANLLAAEFALGSVQSTIDEYAWQCGWSGEGRAAVKDMRGRLAGIKARLDALKVTPGVARR